MSVDYVQFTGDGLKQTLAALLGRAVTVKAVPKAPSPTWAVTATYVRPDGAMQGTCVLDISAAASIGAALTMIPAPVTVTAVKNKAMPEGLMENLQEVLNVMARLFQSAAHERTSLQGVYVTPKAPPPAAAPIFKSPRARLDLEVSVSGYAPGRVTLYCA